MRRRVVPPILGVSLLAGGWSWAGVQSEHAAGPVTYWQENVCHTSELGDGARLRWCAESVVVTETTLELHVSWMGLDLSGKRLYKGSDSANPRMYLLDDLGNRHDHLDTRGAARDGGWLEAARPVLRGAFVFPRPETDVDRFTFRDDDRDVSIAGITLDRESRTDPVASSAVLAPLTKAESLRIDAHWAGTSEGAQEKYVFRRTTEGFRLESGPHATGLSELVVPPPVMELFFQALSESPLLERPYPATTAIAPDYPALTLYLRTGNGDVFFFSRPSGERHVPWRLESPGKNYLVPNDAPLQALEILDPFLERDPQSRAMELLAPHIGDEGAAELWAELEGELEAGEALRVARRLESLLSRGVEENEVRRGLDEYLAARGNGTKRCPRWRRPLPHVPPRRNPT